MGGHNSNHVIANSELTLKTCSIKVVPRFFSSHSIFSKMAPLEVTGDNPRGNERLSGHPFPSFQSPIEQGDRIAAFPTVRLPRNCDGELVVASDPNRWHKSYVIWCATSIKYAPNN
jgi:hypothetical protein